jgi:hypothetical protein
VLQAQLAHIAGRGELPHGPFADLVAAKLGEPMDKLFNAYGRARAMAAALPDEPLVEPTSGPSWTLACPTT